MEKENLKPYIKTPFTLEQVKYLNDYQHAWGVHPFTCMSPVDITECERRAKKSEGVLIASEKGWVCPCGKYTQDWAHGFMAEPTMSEEEFFQKLENKKDQI